MQRPSTITASARERSILRARGRPRRHHRNRIEGVWIALYLALLSHVGTARAGGLPSEIQAALIAKVLQFDKTIMKVGFDRTRLVLLETETSKGVVAEIRAAMKPTGIATSTHTIAELATQIGVSALYLPADASVDRAYEYCIKNKTLSISSASKLCETGRVAVCVGVSSRQKPEIVVHEKLLREMGHVLDASFLGVARVIK